MPPDDPLGRHGPSLDNFLRKKPLPADQKRQLCPYGKIWIAQSSGRGRILLKYAVFLCSWLRDFWTRFWRRNECTSQMTWPITFVFFVCVQFCFPLDKKCTYGIKCKFYHPERTNQSYLSLADELREKAQISTVKEERNARLSPRHLQSEPGPAHSAYSHHQDSNTEHSRAQKSSLHPGQVSENRLLYREDPRKSPNHMPCSVTINNCQKDWPGLHMMPNHYYANVSHECLDSGLGSYESQYSDFCHSNSHRPLPQQPSALAGTRHASVHLEKNNTSQSCRCCSQVPHSAAHQQRNTNLDSKGQPKYDTYPPHMFPPGVQHHGSLPSHLHYSGAPHHQQNYWSDPFQGLPQARSSHSLPSSVHTSQGHSSCHQYHSWGQQQSFSAAFDPQRLELRKNLHTIFNPHEVDTVMTMFPHLMDAEKLAAEILKLKTQKGIFWGFSSAVSSSVRTNMVLVLTLCHSKQGMYWEVFIASVVEWFESWLQRRFNLSKVPSWICNYLRIYEKAQIICSEF